MFKKNGKIGMVVVNTFLCAGELYYFCYFSIWDPVLFPIKGFEKEIFMNHHDLQTYQVFYDWVLGVQYFWTHGLH